MKTNNRTPKITVVSITILFLISSLTVASLGIYEEKNGSVPMLYSLSEQTDSLPYQGYLRICVVEPNSRWKDNDNDAYRYGFLDFAYNDALSIDYLDTYSDTIIWDGNQAGYEDINMNNIMVIAAVFNPEVNKGYANPPFSYPFEAHYVDAVAGATSGDTGSNTVNDLFTHTIFVEVATATYCPYCPAMAEALKGVDESGEYPFFYVSLVKDINQVADDYLKQIYNLYAVPTAFFDGGRNVLVGGYDDENKYTSRIETYGKKDVHELDLNVSLEWMGDSNLQIDISITNNEEIYNSPPEKPSIIGPTTGSPDEELTYEITATDPDDNDLYYYIDWGDGNNSGWLGPYDSGQTKEFNHIWIEKGSYIIMTKARDSFYNESEWSTLEVSMPKNMQIINNYNNPPNPPIITGPTSGNIDETYLYNVTITDPDEDIMFNLEVDFGDGTVYENCGCDQSWQNGTVVKVYHKWRISGSYEITARVQDAYGAWSEWSDPLAVNMPKIKKQADILLMHFLEMLTKLFPQLEYMLDNF